MKISSISSLVFVFATLVGCGSEQIASNGEASSLSAAPAQLIHKIQPLNVNTQCFGSNERIVRDHRYTPTRVYSQYILAIKGCSPPESSLVIQMLGGQQWVGGYSFVTIKKNGLCLTSLVTGNNYDNGETQWKTCVAQNSGSPERFRQQWLLQFNNYNALKIESRAAIGLGFPNAQAQCLDRVNPTTLKRGPCNLHNWQVVRG